MGLLEREAGKQDCVMYACALAEQLVTEHLLQAVVGTCWWGVVDRLSSSRAVVQALRGGSVAICAE